MIYVYVFICRVYNRPRVMGARATQSSRITVITSVLVHIYASSLGYWWKKKNWHRAYNVYRGICSLLFFFFCVRYFVVYFYLRQILSSRLRQKIFSHIPFVSICMDDILVQCIYIYIYVRVVVLTYIFRMRFDIVKYPWFRLFSISSVNVQNIKLKTKIKSIEINGM